MKKLYTLSLALVFGATLSVAQIDVGVTAITAPVNNSNITTVDSVDFTFTVENFGALIPTDSSLYFGFNIDGGPNLMNLYWVLTSDLATNGTLNLITPKVLIGGSPGQFNVCLYTLQPNDIALGNDSSCNTYNLVLGIDNHSVSLNNVFYSDGQLTMNIAGYSPNSEVNLSVMNIAGQVVKNEKFTISKSQMTKIIPMAGLSKGIYIVALRSESRPVQTQKIMVH